MIPNRRSAQQKVADFSDKIMLHKIADQKLIMQTLVWPDEMKPSF